MGKFGREGVSSILFKSNGLTDSWNTPILMQYRYADGRFFALELGNVNGTMNLIFRSISSDGTTILREDKTALNRTI